MKINDTDKMKLQNTLRSFVSLEITNYSRLVQDLARVFEPDEIFSRDALIEWAKSEAAVDEICSKSELEIWAVANGWKHE